MLLFTVLFVVSSEFFKSNLWIEDFGFRNAELMNDVYFGDDLGAISKGLIEEGGTINMSIYYIYKLFSPLPPFFYVDPNFENLFQLLGNHLWHFTLIFFTLNYKYILNSNFGYSGILMIMIFTAIICVLGGTYRHYYSFMPIIAICLFHILSIVPKGRKFNRNIMVSLLLPLLSILLYFIK